MKIIAILLTSLLTATNVVSAGDYLTIKGSDTMVHLGSIWAENFIAQNSDIVFP